MKFLNVLFLSLFLFSVLSANAQTINENWETDLTKLVGAFKTCKGTIENNVNPCSKYSGESLKVVYGLDDFFSKEINRYLTGTEIIKYLETSPQWKKSGLASDQEALTAAQNKANEKIAAVAVYSDENGIGHMALILPGKLKASGLWEKSVPNCSSFFMNSPSSSFSGKGLSYAFSKDMISNVIIYIRNY